MKEFIAVAVWFALSLVGSWIIWSSYMAIWFISEVAQGQHAAFNLRAAHASSGALIVIPILLTAFWVILSLPIAVEIVDNED